MNRGAVILILTLIVGRLCAGPGENWGRAVYDTVPDSLSSKHLVNLFYKSTFELSYDDGMLVRHTIHQKSRIFSAKGLEYNPEFLVPDLSLLHTLVARTIKPDGRIIDLEKQDIKTDRFGKDVAVCRFAFPGAETGDEVELFISYSEKGSYVMEDQFFHHQYFTLQSEITIIAPSYLTIDTKLYNGPVAATTKRDRSSTTHSWLSTNLDAEISSGEFPHLSRPFIRTAIRSRTRASGTKIKIEPASWSEFRKDFRFSRHTGNRLHYDKKFGAFVTRHLGRETDHLHDTVKLENLRKTVSFINDSLEIFEGSYDADSSWLLGDELAINRIPSFALLDLYAVLLDMAHFDYYLCLGRNRFLAQIDSEFVSRNQVTHLFLAFKVNDEVHFLFPRNGRACYDLDEIPVELQGSRAVFFPRKGGASSTKLLGLPAASKTSNTRNLTSFAYVDAARNIITERAKLLTTGAWTTAYRGLYRLLQKDSVADADISRAMLGGPAWQVDSLSCERNEHSVPFVFSLTFRKTDPFILAELDSSLRMLSLDKILTHALPDTSGDRESIAPEMFPFLDNIRYHMIFDRDVTLLDGQQNGTIASGNTAGHMLYVQQPDPRTITIVSRVDFSPVNQSSIAPALSQLHKAVTSAKSGYLLFRMK